MSPLTAAAASINWLAKPNKKLSYRLQTVRPQSYQLARANSTPTPNCAAARGQKLGTS